MNSKDFRPTCGAVRAAKIIMAGKKVIATEYGRKSVLGVAEIIDAESGLRELLEVCERHRRAIAIPALANPSDCHSPDRSYSPARNTHSASN